MPVLKNLDTMKTRIYGIHMTVYILKEKYPQPLTCYYVSCYPLCLTCSVLNSTEKTAAFPRILWKCPLGLLTVSGWQIQFSIAIVFYISISQPVDHHDPKVGGKNI